MRPRRLSFPVLGGLLLALAACGRDAPQAPSAPAGAGPAPVAPGSAPTPDLSRAALSVRLRRALDTHDLEDARAALALLQREHQGTSETPQGAALSAEVTLGAVFDAAVDEARRAIEGPTPDRAHAERALVHADDLGPRVEDTESLAALAAAQRWVALATLGDLSVRLAPHPGPRVVVVADEYDLAEPALRHALLRWWRDGAANGLRVGVVPMQRGWVRVGLRRTRARDRDEERRAMAARIADTGLVLEPEPADADAASADLGLLGQDAAILVADRSGRIAARLSGRGLDPTVLDVVVQKVGSR